jgi:hypothetical protein
MSNLLCCLASPQNMDLYCKSMRDRVEGASPHPPKLVGKASSVAHENKILWRMGGAPQKRRHKNKVFVAQWPVRHRIKVSVAHKLWCATEIKFSMAHWFPCATEIGAPLKYILVCHRTLYRYTRFYTVWCIIQVLYRFCTQYIQI